MEECTHNRVEYGNAVSAHDTVVGIEYERITLRTENAGDNPIAVIKQGIITGKRNPDNQQKGIQADDNTEDEKKVQYDISL
jgi:hypothetical protein